MSTRPKVARAELVGAFGDPIDENPTGIMQEAAFAAAGLNWRYLLLKVAADDLGAAIEGIRAMSFRGINLTIPHKVAVLQHLDAIVPDAATIGAVNTVRREGNRLIGENTDGKGFLRSVREDAGVDPRGKRVVFLGAGGAARAMTVELALAGAAHVTVVNRTPGRGEELVRLLRSKTPVQAEFVPWQGEYAIPPDADMVVNATSIGLYPAVDVLPPVALGSIRPGLLVCDVIPNPPRTAFLKAAAARDARTLDGLGMLVYQGAIGFKLWTGVEPDIAVMRRALEEVFG
ncbi:MAG: shikimate dehydrogenase [Chloroflexi bacterium]|nr:shikimate dehydrogenase [Chloroflexota bacterium]